ncbi:hypothetical protein [uncultured Psychroserpens sp.]|uniref:hypothetical protein n=1 Tax=uncultured Psychroserpens sp. TaxID=255436 RepID=UPI00260E802D|nr:hypothetical protein [uncultured Psychroserpens sp.]
MNTITKQVVLIFLCLIANTISAQEQQQDSIITDNHTFKRMQISKLEKLKDQIQTEEREFLKSEVEAINIRLEKKEITQFEADKLKQEAAQKRAANIEDRIAIIDTKIALIERNEYKQVDLDEGTEELAFSVGKDGLYINIRPGEKKRKTPKFDKRTTTDLVFAIGINNAFIDGESIGDSYSVLGSGFVELGLAWKTRVFQNSNAVRLKYGFSFQWNKFSPKDDRYFVQDGNTTMLDQFPSDLRESEFRVTNLVVPIHFEFGPSKKIEKKTYFRYSTRKQFKIGIGGYAGFNIGTQQKLRFKEDGDRVKQKIKRNYNTSDFVYGLSTYIGVGNTSLYFKYDLNTVFKDQVTDQNNVSLGLRFDFD